MSRTKELEQHVKMQVIWALRGYNDYKRKYEEEKEAILTFGSQNYSTRTNPHAATEEDKTERVYIPSGGSTGSQVEDKAMRLLALEETYGFRVIKAVELAQKVLIAILSQKKTYSEREKITEKLFESCVEGRHFNFDYAGILSIGRAQFYNYRTQFIKVIAEELKIL